MMFVSFNSNTRGSFFLILCSFCELMFVFFFFWHLYGLIITSHMQNIIQIYPSLLKLSHKLDTILNNGDFSTKN
jgi:hypothetical protein